MNRTYAGAARATVTAALAAAAAVLILAISMLAPDIPTARALGLSLSEDEMDSAIGLSVGAKKIGVSEDSETDDNKTAYRSWTPLCKIDVATESNYTLTVEASADSGILPYQSVSTSDGKIVLNSGIKITSNKGWIIGLLYDSSGKLVFTTGGSSRTATSESSGYRLSSGYYYAVGFMFTTKPEPGYSISLSKSTSIAGTQISLGRKSYVVSRSSYDKKPKVTVNYNGKKLRSGSDYTVKYSGFKMIGTATATVAGKGLYYGTRVMKYAILPTGTKIRSLVAKKNSRYSYVALRWKEAPRDKKGKPEYSGYQIRYSTKKSMAASTIMNIPIRQSSANIGQKSQTRGKVLHFQVRTYKKVGGKNYCSAWSAKKSVKTLR